ncbi:NAD(P)H-dependent oxidoreductase [Catenuloplanes atrovinosus]|uniref:NAD(P)H dehydrogenase (Quinone) n=1 Tax=Catenuloplanes atrovinosus TaxID=137266 RepID=A0AAE3YNL7_9ACTN|nr:NAD(P)H-dependent oxidoreductase [Catenuloplanes atrovinosus]MDR7277133.1 NAD(P)H dehydrogenase (quinone) [Catenuloplanes atrovinosus]
MDVLWIQAHPEPRSLNGFLAAAGRRALRTDGHRVEVSDLYAMRWNPVVDAADYGHDPAGRFQVAHAAGRAHTRGTVSEDIRAEQRKIDRADTIVVQFPMWWFGMPAILKGWFDRVWHKGYAYGHRGPRGEWIGYGDGFLAGKRALAVVTMGGPPWFYGERGIHGAVDDLLFPLQHGLLFYAGATVLPPVLVHGTDRFTAANAETAAEELRERLRTMPVTEPLPYRTQTGGDYDERFVLRPEIAPGVTGLRAHLRERDKESAGGRRGTAGV